MYGLMGLGCACQQHQPSMWVSQDLGALQTTPKFSDTPTTDWSCQQWIQWHQALVNAFKAGSFSSGIKYSQADALKNANNVFNIHWDKSASFMRSNFCGYESQFFSYFKSVGLDNILSYFQAVITPTAKAAGDVAQSASNIATNAADAIDKTSKVSTWLIPTLLIGAGVGVSVYVYKNYIKGNSRVKVAGKTV